MAQDVLLIIAGLVLLIAGAEVLVKGASRIATTFRVPPLIIGLTIVSFGTGAPELVVGLRAAIEEAPSIVIGNVVGSNVINVLAGLGLSALVAPLAVASRLVRLDVPIMIGVSILLLALALNGHIGRVEGAILVVGFFAFLGFLISHRRQSPETENLDNPIAQRTAFALTRHVAMLVGGGASLSFGADLLVDGASNVAIEVGVSQLIIGLTVVAIGTSLPELTTSLLAAIRGQRDIAVGNIVGSNIFNILVVIGSSALASSRGLAVDSAAINFDMPVMLAAAIVCLPIFFTRHRIDRWEGWLLFGYFLAYVLYLLLRASELAAANEFNLVMVAVVFPLTFITLALVSWREWLKRAQETASPRTPTRTKQT